MSWRLLGPAGVLHISRDNWDKCSKIIVLTDLQVAIAAIKNAGKMGKARMGELRKVIRGIVEGKRELRPKTVSFGWDKSHIGIKGNEEADKKAKLEAKE